MSDSAVKIKLLPSEGSFGIMMVASVATATCYRGAADEARELLRERLSLVIEANPWLCGRLVKEKKETYLAYDAGALAVEDVLADKASSPAVSSEWNWQTLARTVCKNPGLTVPPGNKCVGKKVGLFKVAVLPDSAAKEGEETQGEGFVLIVTMSHVIADGCTYYAVLNMLWEGAEIKALDPVRLDAFEEASEAALGKKEKRIGTNPAVIFNFLSGSLFYGKKAKVLARLVDKERLAKAKEEAAAGSEVPYVSTNDIVTSTFARATNAHLFQMAINLRGRMGTACPATTGHAGNYEGVIPMFPGDFERPDLIRRTVSGRDDEYKRCGDLTKAFPGGWTLFRGRIALVSNWATFTGSLALGPGYKQFLHVPIFDDSPGMPLDLCIIFSPRPQETATLMFMHGKDLSTTFKDTVLCNMVSETMFPEPK